MPGLEVKKILWGVTALVLVLLVGCSLSEGSKAGRTDALQGMTGKADIVNFWHGDYPADQLNLLPETQRGLGVGVIEDARTFKTVWQAFKPGQDIPEIDFKETLVLFARNIQYYNRIAIGQVNVTDGVAEVLAMETMSARPIEDKVGMSLAAVSRKGITAVRSGEKILRIKAPQ